MSSLILLPPASGASNSLEILQDFQKVVYSGSTPFYVGITKQTLAQFCVHNFPSYILSHNVKLTILNHEAIVSVVSSAHDQRCDQIKSYQDEGTNLLKVTVHFCVVFK